MLTASDYAAVRYFILDKGDVTRWVGWREKRPLFEQQHPELIKALRDLEASERILKAVVESLPDADT
jgi:hypothetical protein